MLFHDLDDRPKTESEKDREGKPREPRLWRPHCAVMAELAAEYDAVLVAFDGAAYTRWRGLRRDTEALRGQWAATFAG